MWEKLTPADIERAKTRAATLRSEAMQRHAEELKALDADEAEIEVLQRLIADFSEKYMRGANTATVDATAAPLLTEGATDATGRAEAQPDVVSPRLQVQQQVSPNFGVPVRRLLRG